MKNILASTFFVAN